MNDIRDQVLALVDQGLSSREVARELGVRVMSVAAYKAHRTMGTYEGSWPAADNGNAVSK